MKFKQILFSIFLVLIFSINAYALNKIDLGPEYFPQSTRGRPLSNAYIYVGLPDTDPEIVGNQKTLSVQQEDGTIVEVAQPIRASSGGIPLYDDAPVTLLVDGDYSLKILNSSGSQIYYVPNRSWDITFEPGNYYYPDYLATDQGVTGDNNTIKYYVDTIGATEIATIYLRHNEENDETTYTLSTNETISSNITFVIEPGAIIDIDGGVVLIIGKMDSFERLQKFSGAGSVNFEDGAVKEIYPEWWTSNITPKTTDMTTAVQAAITAAIPNNTPVVISSMMFLTASVDIDRAVDGAAYDEYFEIISHNGGGFYVSTAIDMFSSTIAFAAAPVSQLIKFNNVYFESSDSALAAYVLDDSRFLRTQFHGCSFSKIKCLTASIYTQSIYFFQCNMRRWAGIFYNSPVISFDIKFHGCLAEAGENFAVVHAAVGTSFLGTTIEGMSGTAIEYNQAQGLTISGCYFELNDKDIEDAVEGAESSWGVAITGSLFSHTPAGGYAPSSDYSIIWALCDGCVSKGNYFSYKGHNLLTTSQVEINDHAVNDIANRYPNPAFLVRPTADQDNIAHTTDVEVIWGTEIFDKGGCFAANTFTAPLTGVYQLSVSLELHEVDSEATWYSLTIATSNRNYIQKFSGSMLAADGAFGIIAMSVLADMDAADIVTVRIRQEAGTQQTDIGTQSFFSGHFVGF